MRATAREGLDSCPWSEVSSPTPQRVTDDVGSLAPREVDRAILESSLNWPGQTQSPRSFVQMIRRRIEASWMRSAGDAGSSSRAAHVSTSTAEAVNRCRDATCPITCIPSRTPSWPGCRMPAEGLLLGLGALQVGERSAGEDDRAEPALLRRARTSDRGAAGRAARAARAPAGGHRQDTCPRRVRDETPRESPLSREGLPDAAGA